MPFCCLIWTHLSFILGDTTAHATGLEYEAGLKANQQAPMHA